MSRTRSPEEKGQSIYVADFPSRTDARDLKEFIEDKLGVPVDRVDMKAKFAFMFLQRSVSGLDKYDGIEFKGRRLRIERVRGDGRTKQRERRRRSDVPNETLFIVNFDPDNTTRRDIERFFEKFNVKEVALERNFAFVTCKTIEDAKDAVRECDGKWLGNRQITVEFKAGEGSGGGGGGGRRASRSPPRRSLPRGYGYDRYAPYPNPYGLDRRSGSRRRRRSPSDSRSPPPRRDRSPRRSRSPVRRSRSPRDRRR